MLIAHQKTQVDWPRYPSYLRCLGLLLLVSTLQWGVNDSWAAPRRRPKREAPAKKAPAPEPPEAQKADEPIAPVPISPPPPAAAPTVPPPISAPSATATESTAPTNGESGTATIDELRQEYLALKDELFASRARSQAVASQLYSTQVVIKFKFDAGRYYSVPKAIIRLDGASVFEDTQGTIASDDAVRFSGFVAPGRHVVSFRVESIGKDDNRFTSNNEAQVSIEAIAGKDLMVTARAKDAGDIPYQWKRSESGDYALSLSVAVKTSTNAASGTKAARAAK
jgi:hypothetical protein